MSLAIEKASGLASLPDYMVADKPQLVKFFQILKDRHIKPTLFILSHLKMIEGLRFFVTFYLMKRKIGIISFDLILFCIP